MAHGKVTKREAAQMLGVTTWTVGRYARDGKLTVSYRTDHIGRIALYDPQELARLNSQRALSRNNRSGYRGVVWDPCHRRWSAQIQHRKRIYRLGSFDSPEEAALAYDAQARKLLGEKAKLNFPQRRVSLKEMMTKQRARRWRNNTSGFIGVSRARDRFEAKIQHQGKRYHLGLYDSAEEAARAYDRAAKRLKGQQARLNFPSLAAPPSAMR